MTFKVIIAKVNNLIIYDTVKTFILPVCSKLLIKFYA